MTEDEAKTKVCCGPPIVAAMTLLASPNGIETGVSHPGRCVASECAAWRWRPAVGGYYGQQRTIDGYCGLAGPPQG